MYSGEGNRCSHRLGSPIQKSPDRRLLASPRSLSQLATSFIAFQRQGIPTHALSSLTIKFTLDTEYILSILLSSPPYIFLTAAYTTTVYFWHGGSMQLVYIAHQIFNCQRTKTCLRPSPPATLKSYVAVSRCEIKMRPNFSRLLQIFLESGGPG
jgi:hypothetical protein